MSPVLKSAYKICIATAIFTIVALALTMFYLSPNVKAHPGNTASDGCHYCRTNCEYWGEVYGERHCHGGSTSYSTTPTYTQQGTTNGANWANTNNKAYIESNAKAEGTSEGRTAANATPRVSTQNTNSDEFCGREPVFDTPQPQEYVTAYKFSYKSACAPIYNAAYSSAFTTAYAAVPITASSSVTSNSSKDNNDSSFNIISWLADYWLLVMFLGIIGWGLLSNLWEWLLKK